jgi:hypothetical protein
LIIASVTSGMMTAIKGKHENNLSKLSFFIIMISGWSSNLLHSNMQPYFVA